VGPNGCPPFGPISGIVQVGSQKECLPRGFPMGVQQGCHPRVPQGGFPMVTPPRSVPQGWAPKVVPQVMPQWVSPKLCPTRWVPRVGFSEGVPQVVSPREVKGVHPKRVNEGGPPREAPRVAAQEGSPTAVPEGGPPKGVPPMGYPIRSSRLWVPQMGRHVVPPRGLLKGGSPNAGHPRGFSNRGTPSGVFQVRYTKGAPKVCPQSGGLQTEFREGGPPSVVPTWDPYGVPTRGHQVVSQRDVPKGGPHGWSRMGFAPRVFPQGGPPMRFSRGAPGRVHRWCPPWVTRLGSPGAPPWWFPLGSSRNGVPSRSPKVVRREGPPKVFREGGFRIVVRQGWSPKWGQLDGNP
jgi:hypothetical protein